MKNRLGGLIWGLILIGVGIGYAGNAFGLWNFELFFNGWWTLFIIIPCLVSIIQNGFNVANGLGLVVGVLFLLAAQNVIDDNIIGKSIVPLVLVAVGLTILFRGNYKKHTPSDPDVIEVNNLYREGGIPEYTAVFGGQDVRFSGEKFKGASLICIFGGIDLNLKDAVIDEDVTIYTTTIFGGADILVPANVKVKVLTTPIFGGVSNKAASNPNAGAPTVYISSTCIFGGVDIK